MLTDPDISHVADDELDRAIAERNEEMKVQADLSEISADDKRKKSALGHRDRVRERFLNGLEGFADHEILELLLFYTIPRQDTSRSPTSLSTALTAWREYLTLTLRSFAKQRV